MLASLGGGSVVWHGFVWYKEVSDDDDDDGREGGEGGEEVIAVHTACGIWFVTF